MKNLLVRVGLWLARKGGWTEPVPPPPSAIPKLPLACEAAEPYRQRAQELILLEEPRDASGESKRHQVYARLMKDYPEASRKHLALAIELAVNS